MFLSWWYLKANIIKKKKKWWLWDLYVASFSFLFLFAQGGGLNISSLLLDYLFFFFCPDPEWLNEWVLLAAALPVFPQKLCTPSLSLKSSMWETSWSVKLESPQPLTLVNFYPWEWFYELNHFLLLVPKTTAVQVKLFCVHFILNRLPSLYYLQCTPA